MSTDQPASERPMAKPTVQVENDRVIVTEWRFPPGGHTGWHRHNHDYVVVPVTTGELHIFDGKTTVRSGPASRTPARPASSTTSSIRTISSSCSWRSSSRPDPAATQL